VRGVNEGKLEDSWVLVLTSRVGYGGFVGRVIKIWWTMAHGQRFAITIEEDVLRMHFWILWYHWNGVWVYQVFLEEQRDEVMHWFSLYGHVEKVAIVTDGYDMYMMME